MSFNETADMPLTKPLRRHIPISYCILASLVGIGFISSAIWTAYPLPEMKVPMGLIHSALNNQPADPFASMNYLKGPPTTKFRDNLLPEVKYITSWLSAGWTNDVMTYINLIYMGILTDRVPVIGLFTPSHIGGRVPPINFGDVFDVPRLRREMKRPLVEWHEVKNRSADIMDELGCWNTWEAVQDHEKYPRQSSLTDILKLDISYTKAPTWIKVIPNFEHDKFSYFSSLAVLAFPEAYIEDAIEPKESTYSRVKLPPDEHMLCYDYLFYTCAHRPNEFEFDYSPAWRFVGQYMHWNAKLESIAIDFVRKALQVEGHSQTPPWISIHIRHGDFANWCGDVAVDDCFAPISVIARRVDEVKEEILIQRGLVVRHVIMTSDEKNATWWQAAVDQGWYRVDTSDAVEHYGAWYPVLIDAVIQSRGIGFVGTQGSTMSTLARRRVESWNDGVVRIVKWGSPGADDH